jgi:DNA primase catalytic core
MADIQEIYSILLSSQYQDRLFGDLNGQKRAGKETTADCPICGRKGKFSYSSERPVWQCWSASCPSQTMSRDWLGYLTDVKGLDFKLALAELAREAGVQLPQVDQRAYQAYSKRADILDTAQEYLWEQLWAPAGRAVLSYLVGRGYSEQDIRAMHEAGFTLGAYTSRAGLLEHLKSRGYSPEEARQAGLLSAGLGEDFQLTLAWRDAAGRPIGLVGRALDSRTDKYRYTAGLQKGSGLLGIEKLRGSQHAILVEGVLDTPYIASKGLPLVSTGGASLSREQLLLLERAGVKQLVLLMDSDESGQRATDRAIQAIRTSGSILKTYVATLPDGYKDPDELVRAKGLKALEKVLGEAQGWAKWLTGHILSQHDITTERGCDLAVDQVLETYLGIENPADRTGLWAELLVKLPWLTRDALEHRLELLRQRRSEAVRRARLEKLSHTLREQAREGRLLEAELSLAEVLQELQQSRGVQPPEPYLLEHLLADLDGLDGLETGFAVLDELVRVPLGAITLVAGRPSHGKTALLLNLLLNFVNRYEGRRFYFYSYEESRRELATKLIMMLAGEVLDGGFNLYAYRGYLRGKRGSNPEIDKAIATYEELVSSGRLWLIDQALVAEDLSASIAQLNSRGETGAVFVDYIQKVRTRAPAPTRQVEVQRASEMLREVAVAQDIPLIMGAQLGRAAGQTEKVKLDNLREAGDLEQDANLVIGLFNQAMQKAQDEQTTLAQPTADLLLTVLKNRAGGGVGQTVTLSFNRPVLRITRARSSLV